MFRSGSTILRDGAKRVGMMKRLLPAVSVVVLCMSCALTSSKSDAPTEFRYPVEMFGAAGDEQVNYDVFPKYCIMPGDILDMLFHFDTAKGKTFVIQPQDIIEIKFPEAAELNEEQRVRPDGLISLAYVGDVRVIELTPSELQQKLRNLYSPILNNPEIFVSVKEYGGRLLELKESIRNAPRGQSKLITVRNDGFATFPLVGDIRVSGLTLFEAGNVLNERFHKITTDVQVDLLLHEAVGSKIYVLGAVASPGSYVIDRPVNVVEALALAGGYMPDARLSETLIMRREGDTMLCRRVDFRKILGAKPGAVQVVLSTNDALYIPLTRDAKAAQIARNIGEILFFRGWSLGFSVDLVDFFQDDQRSSN